MIFKPGDFDCNNVCAEIANRKFNDWLEKQPKAYSCLENNVIWYVPNDAVVPKGYKFMCRLVCVKNLDDEAKVSDFSSKSVDS